MNGPKKDHFVANLAEIDAYKSRHLCMLWRIKKKSKAHSASPLAPALCAGARFARIKNCGAHPDPLITHGADT